MDFFFCSCLVVINRLFFKSRKFLEETKIQEMKINVRLLFVTSTITAALSLVAMVVIVPLPTVTAHHSQSRTLAIVFDVTFSMIADLEHLKFVIADIFKDITENLDRRYSDYLFLAFHDPGEICK